MLDTHLDREHTRGWVNIRSLGADEENADNTDVLRLAHDLLPDSGGIIFVPGGPYRFTTWNITKPVEIRGSGRSGWRDVSLYGASVLLKTGLSDGVVISSPRGARISDLQVDGAPGNAGDGIVLSNGVLSAVRNVSVTNHGGVGLRVGCKQAIPANVNSWHVERVLAAGNGSHGIYLHSLDAPAGPNANGGTMLNVEARENGGDGLRLETALFNTYLGVVAELNTGWGVNVAPLAAQDCFNTFVGGDYEGNVAGQFQLTANANRNNLVQQGNSVIVNLGFLNTIIKSGQVSAQINPLTDGGFAQSGQLYQGAGVPAGGANGDFYFRTDGAAGTSLYMKRAGVWVGVL